MERYRPYFSFSGRINRQPYWLTALALVPAYLVAFLLAVFIPVLGPLAAAILVGGIKPSKAPIVPIVVDDTFGPGRGQTLCDMRGQRAGMFDHEGLKTRVVLETDKPLRPHLIERLLTFSVPH